MAMAEGEYMFGAESLDGKTILFCLVDGFNPAHFEQISNCLGLQGAAVQVAGFSGESNLTSSDGRVGLISDLSFAQAADSRFDAVIIADNVTANAIKEEPAVLRLIEKTLRNGNSAVVSIGDGAQVLISTGIVKNRFIAAPLRLSEALRQAGAKHAGTPIAIDENLFSTDAGADMDVLCRDLSNFLAHGQQRRVA